jgi:hypothetical protein
MTGSTYGGSEGGVRSIGSGNSTIGGASTSSSETSSEMAIKNFCSLHLCPKIFFITIIAKALELAFNHFCLGQFMDLEWSGRRGGSGGFRVGNKGGFSSFDKRQLVVLPYLF